MGDKAAEAGKWQTVKGKQPDVKKKRSSEPSLAPAARIETTDSVFSALDESYNRRNRQRHAHQSSADGIETSHLNGTGPASATSEDSESSTTEDVTQKPREVTAKAKKPKPKRAKVTPSQAATGLDSKKFADLLASVQQTYPDNQLSQLQTLADQLLSAFQTSELPFNKLLSEAPLDKVTDVPLQDLPQDVKHILERYAAHLDIHVVSQFVQRLVEAVLETVPEGNSKQAAPKAKVGLLMMLSLLLRAEPAALLLRSQALLDGGKRFSGPNRLPLLLWLINQTARCNPATAISIWLRVLLPQILGMQLPTVINKTAPPAEEGVLVMSSNGINTSLSYLDSLLSKAHEAPVRQRTNDHGFPEWHGGSANLGPSHSVLHRLAAIGVKYAEPDGTSITEAVVPPAALQAIVRSQFTEASHLQTAQRIQLLKQYEVLLELGFSGSSRGGFSCQESMRLSLDTATLSEGPFEGPGDETVDQAARNMLSCLAYDSKSADTWESRHKTQLKGSTRVLQHLLHVFPKHFQPIQNSRHGKATLLKLLQTLRQRHQNQLNTGKGWAKSCAKGSDAACIGLQRKLRNRSGALGATLLITLTMVLAIIALAYNPETQEVFNALVGTETSEQVNSAVRSLQSKLAPVAESVQQAVSPYLRQVSSAARPAFDAIKAQAELYTEQVSSLFATALQRFQARVAS